MALKDLGSDWEGKFICARKDCDCTVIFVSESKHFFMPEDVFDST